MSRISLVVAASRNGVIGRDGGLPWRLPSDLKRFKAITMGKPVIMGRKTWDSLPVKPLPGRRNIVITRQTDFSAPGAETASGVTEAIAQTQNAPDICVIGGGEIYRMFLDRADRIYLTEVDVTEVGDTQFPAIDPSEWREISSEHVAPGPKDSASFTVRVFDRIRD